AGADSRYAWRARSSGELRGTAGCRRCGRSRIRVGRKKLDTKESRYEISVARKFPGTRAVFAKPGHSRQLCSRRGAIASRRGRLVAMDAPGGGTIDGRRADDGSLYTPVRSHWQLR